MPAPPTTAPWRVVYFKRDRRDDPAETRPGRVFLAGCPEQVATRLIAFLDAVRDAPPPQFSGGGIWEAMHGEMSGYYEVRARARKQLYRLFCLLEHQQPGLPANCIVVITGMVKENDTAFTAGDYDAVRALGDEYRSRSPRSVA
jgi:hypothetical protein